jgi:hypothetical protein
MKATLDMYVPSLRWRQGEYQALLRLDDATKRKILPFITIPSIEYDFEDRKPKRTVEEHVAKFPARFTAKWGHRPAWINVDPSLRSEKLAVGTSAVSYVFGELAKVNSEALPVVSLDDDASYLSEIAKIVAQQRRGVGLRIRLEHLMKASLFADVGGLLNTVRVSEQDADILVDIGAPTYDPYAVFARALISALSKLPLESFRLFAVIGTGFPESLTQLMPPGGTFKRHDWIFYRTLISMLPTSMRRPLFGDFTIVHPSFTASIDMRVIKPAGKLIYTAGDYWLVRKGGAFRDDPHQMYGHCADILGSGQFRGKDYSYSDDYIALCARKQASHSTLTKWKEVGVGHHITHVVEDLANLV